MRYSLIFFPLVGAVIAGISYVTYCILSAANISEVAIAFILTALAIAITGGFHLDGFMDVSDALSSFGDRDKKLQIMKDPHIGAFAVIRLVMLLLVYLFAVSVITGSSNHRLVALYLLSFVISRALSAIALLKLKKAKQDGMLVKEAEGTGSIVFISQIVYLILAATLALYLSPVAGSLLIVSSVLSLVYYKCRSYREFGGITGDTAGYFLVITETQMTLIIAIFIIAAKFWK